MPDPAQEAALEKLEQLRQRLIAAHDNDTSWLSGWLLRRAPKAPPRGLYLWGPVGRGKTWLMDLFHRSLPFPESRRRHFHRFMQEVHGQLSELKEQESPLEEVAQRLARDTRVLCFDELYVSDIADAMILGGLFEALFRRGVALVATSNSPPWELYKDGLQRQRFLPAIELLEQHTEVVTVDGGVDYRRRQLQQAGTYLLSGAPGTERQMEALFGELSGQAPVNREPLEVAGRRIPIIRRAAGVVWFTFDALCAGPRSQEDYIEIAREHHSVLLSDVPAMTTRQDNEARRFIALVDELYDRRVHLILSAAATPAQLYTGEALAGPFERTVSRLIEMQSEEYLASEHRA